MCSVSFATAPSKPRPASTDTASRSSASGSSARIASRRERPRIPTKKPGMMKPPKPRMNAENDADRNAAGRGPDREAENDAADRACGLQREERGRCDRAAHPGRHQPACDRVERRAGVQPERQLREPRRRRHEHALLELQPLEPGAGDAVATVGRRAPDGAIALPAGLRHDVADEIRGGGEEEERECEEDLHLISP